MTIDEAVKRWDVKEKTIKSYIKDGLIKNLSKDEKIIILPDIPKPFKRKSKTSNQIYSNIIKACKRQYYINPKLMQISNETFIAAINELEKNDVLVKTRDDLEKYSNLNYFITYKFKNCGLSSLSNIIGTLNVISLSL